MSLSWSDYTTNYTVVSIDGSKDTFSIKFVGVALLIAGMISNIVRALMLEQVISPPPPPPPPPPPSSLTLSLVHSVSGTDRYLHPHDLHDLCRKKLQLGLEGKRYAESESEGEMMIIILYSLQWTPHSLGASDLFKLDYQTIQTAIINNVGERGQFCTPHPQTLHCDLILCLVCFTLSL